MWNPIILDVECIVCNKSLHKINHNPGEVSMKMGKIINRRSRTPNWSVEEKKYLLELIRDRKDVVVNKTNNGPNLYEEKDQAWHEILGELTERYGNKFHTFNIKKLKTQWQNMKRIAREEITAHGPQLDKISRQSYEVCCLLDIIKDGVLVNPNTESDIYDTTMNSTNVEVKTERMDEDLDNIPLAQALALSSYRRPSNATETQQHQENGEASCNTNVSETTSLSEQTPISDTNDFDMPQDEDEMPHDEMPQEIPQGGMPQDEMPQDEMIQDKTTRNFSTNTENSIPDPKLEDYPFRRGLQRFLSFTNEEKQLKLQTLKEERQVVRAMRETAELNKIIAEQRLKHVLWVKRQEMGMYSGEPGSGAGKGGGGGGAIREAGGAFGKMEAAREDEYFYRKQKEQLENLKSHLNKEISFHQDQIKRHEDAIKRHKEQMASADDKK